MDQYPFQSEIISILRPYSQFIFLFGSLLTPRFSKESDVDIAFFPSRSISFDERLQLMDKLSDVCQGRNIDLIDLTSADYIISMQILSNGKVIDVVDDKALLSFKMRIMNLYPDFKYSRKVIEDNLTPRKKNHA